MKQYLLLVLLCITAAQSWGMDAFLRRLSGEQRVEYIQTTGDQREKPINILNQTGKSILLQATYSCKTKLIYTAFCCFGSWCAIPATTGITESNDTYAHFNNGYTITLIPIKPKLARSVVKLYALKALFAEGRGEWVTQKIPDEAQNSYQDLQGIEPKSRTYILTQEFGVPVLQ